MQTAHWVRQGREVGGQDDASGLRIRQLSNKLEQRPEQGREGLRLKFTSIYTQNTPAQSCCFVSVTTNNPPFPPRRMPAARTLFAG